MMGYPCKKLLEIFTMSISYLTFKVNNKNDMAVNAFGDSFCSSQRPSEISQTAEKPQCSYSSVIIFLGYEPDNVPR